MATAFDCDKMLCDAVESGDVMRAKKAIAAGADANQFVLLDDGLVETLLTVAASKGDSKMVDALLDAGARVNRRSKIGGYGPVHRVISYPTILGMFCERRDVNLDAGNVFGQTALHEAAREGQKEAVEILLDAGADVAAVDRSGETALDYAKRAGMTEIVAMLGGEPVEEARLGGVAPSAYTVFVEDLTDSEQTALRVRQDREPGLTVVNDWASITVKTQDREEAIGGAKMILQLAGVKLSEARIAALRVEEARLGTPYRMNAWGVNVSGLAKEEVAMLQSVDQEGIRVPSGAVRVASVLADKGYAYLNVDGAGSERQALEAAKIMLTKIGVTLTEAIKLEAKEEKKGKKNWKLGLQLYNERKRGKKGKAGKMGKMPTPGKGGKPKCEWHEPMRRAVESIILEWSGKTREEFRALREAEENVKDEFRLIRIDDPKAEKWEIVKEGTAEEIHAWAATQKPPLEWMEEGPETEVKHLFRGHYMDESGRMYVFDLVWSDKETTAVEECARRMKRLAERRAARKGKKVKDVKKGPKMALYTEGEEKINGLEVYWPAGLAEANHDEWADMLLRLTKDIQGQYPRLGNGRVWQVRIESVSPPSLRGEWDVWGYVMDDDGQSYTLTALNVDVNPRKHPGLHGKSDIRIEAIEPEAELEEGKGKKKGKKVKGGKVPTPGKKAKLGEARGDEEEGDNRGDAENTEGNDDEPDRIPDAPELAKLLDVKEEKAKKIRALMTGTEPDDVDKNLDEINDLLDGNGVEAVQPEGADVDEYYKNAVLLYVNMGDTYDTTVWYDIENAEWGVGAWGDWYEAWEAEHPEEMDDEDNRGDAEDTEEEDTSEAGNLKSAIDAVVRDELGDDTEIAWTESEGWDGTVYVDVPKGKGILTIMLDQDADTEEWTISEVLAEVDDEKEIRDAGTYETDGEVAEFADEFKDIVAQMKKDGKVKREKKSTKNTKDDTNKEEEGPVEEGKKKGKKVKGKVPTPGKKAKLGESEAVESTNKDNEEDKGEEKPKKVRTLWQQKQDRRRARRLGAGLVPREHDYDKWGRRQKSGEYENVSVSSDEKLIGESTNKDDHLYVTVVGYDEGLSCYWYQPILKERMGLYGIHVKADGTYYKDDTVVVWEARLTETEARECAEKRWKMYKIPVELVEDETPDPVDPQTFVQPLKI